MHTNGYRTRNGIDSQAGGFLLDKILGDPLWLPHPAVGFGKLISRCERRGNQGSSPQTERSVDRSRAGCANLSSEQGALKAAALLHPWVKIALR